MKSETTRAAAPRLLVPLPSGDARRDARALADVLRLVVPDLVGLSLVVRDADGPWTVATTGDDAAALDAVQDLTGGPRPTPPGSQPSWVVLGDPDAAAWTGLWSAATRLGVGAVLSVCASDVAPLEPHDVIVHVYAASVPDHDGVDQVMTALAAWTRRADDLRLAHLAARESRPLPAGSLHQQGSLARAVARIAVRQGLDVVTAQERLCDAARRAGVLDHDLASLLTAPVVATETPGGPAGTRM